MPKEKRSTPHRDRARGRAIAVSHEGGHDALGEARDRLRETLITVRLHGDSLLFVDDILDKYPMLMKHCKEILHEYIERPGSIKFFDMFLLGEAVDVYAEAAHKKERKLGKSFGDWNHALACYYADLVITKKVSDEIQIAEYLAYAMKAAQLAYSCDPKKHLLPLALARKVQAEVLSIKYPGRDKNSEFCASILRAATECLELRSEMPVRTRANKKLKLVFSQAFELAYESIELQLQDPAITEEQGKSLVKSLISLYTDHDKYELEPGVNYETLASMVLGWTAREPAEGGAGKASEQAIKWIQILMNDKEFSRLLKKANLSGWRGIQACVLDSHKEPGNTPAVLTHAPTIFSLKAKKEPSPSTAVAKVAPPPKASK